MEKIVFGTESEIIKTRDFISSVLLEILPFWRGETQERGTISREGEKKINKINTLVFIGPTNTGKSLLANLIGKPYLKGYVQRSAEGNSFHFEGLLNKSVAMLEEPRITALTMNDYKVLLGGEDFEVNKKHQAPEILKRIPVLITTNAPIGSYLQAVDAQALDNRAITIHIDKQLNVNKI